MPKISLFVVSLLLLASCARDNVTTVSLEVTGDKSQSVVFYAPPINGTCFEGFADTLDLDTTLIKLDIDKPSFIYMRLGQNIGKFILEPGDKYHLAIDLEKGDFVLSGPNEKGHRLYKEFPNPYYVELEGREIFRGIPIDSISEKIEQLKEADLSGFKALLDSAEITQPYYDLVQSDRDCYFAVMEMMAAFYLRSTPDLDLKVILDYVSGIYEKYPVDNPAWNASMFWREYATKYVSYYMTFMDIEKGILDEEDMKQMYRDGIYVNYILNEAKKYLTGKNLEYFTATFIYSEAFNKNYEKELISTFEQFEKDYPQSGYSEYIKPEIDEIRAYHKALEADYSENVKFLPAYGEINSLKEALKPFAGKRLYIDVWATWCSPCKVEFQHNDELKKILKDNDIPVLYISIDDERRDQQWKDMIKFYNLEGYHVRVNAEFEKDLRRLYDANGMIAIPWYILIDEKGNITELHAKKPSEIVIEKDYFKQDK